MPKSPSTPLTTTTNHSTTKAFQEGTNPSGNGSSSKTSATDALRNAVRELETRGITDATDLVRAGAAAMVHRAVTAFDARQDVGTGWLAQVIRSGGPWNERPGPTEYEQTRERRHGALVDQLAAVGIEL